MEVNRANNHGLKMGGFIRKDIQRFLHSLAKQ